VARKRLIALVVSALACSPSVKDESTGEVLVVVDTDMPVPAFVSRLRVDLYGANGVWYASRDVSLARALDWPTGFGVSAADDERVVLVRLRAYPEGGLRDYRGERFTPRLPPSNDVASLADPPAPTTNGQPRLLGDDGTDQTPAEEPQPLVAIDRLLRVRVAPSERGVTHVTLRGACVGTMADVAGARTCIDSDGVLVPVAIAERDDDGTPRPSSQGAFDPKSTCTAPLRTATQDLHDDEVCVSGAMFMLGSADGDFGTAPALPSRVAIVDAFRFDRWEVSVARWRKAIADGFTSPDDSPTANEGAIPPSRTDYLDPRMCSWSTTPRARETYPLTCVTQAAARAFCRFQGGDLPTEAQWEYAAQVSGRDHKTRFVWGGDDDLVPTCDRAVWGRGELLFAGELCTANGYGPLAIDAHVGPNGDVTPSLGITGLGGNVAEWMRDAFASFTASCWAQAGLHDPQCVVDPSMFHTIRGGSWRDNLAGLVAANRRSWDTRTSGIGFRCARSGSP
jgi:formylglycine-generating enzyme required for sulfatase activity